MRFLKRTVILALLLSTAACQKSIFEPKSVSPTSLRDVAALRLGFRYEADVPAPAVAPQSNSADEKSPAVQADFDANRPQEVLERTISSPNKQRLLAVYQRAGDRPNTFRLDMYSADGKFLRRVSSETMAVDFPDIIVWSPDSQSAAFVAIARDGGLSSLSPLPVANSNANTSLPKSSTDANSNSNANIATPTPAAPAVGDAAPEVVTFRTEQIYLCNSEGLDLKPLTQSEGRIYYYFVWAPDSSMLVALAATAVEWRRLEEMAAQRGESLVPMGRPRIVEKNGRERLLDDNLTSVHPVWSPDSAKVAVGFLKDQIRIYDAIGDQPTQAAVPIRNELLFSSQAYDLKVTTENANVDANAASNTSAPTPSTTLPDERTLVSFQPITTLEWTLDSEIYFQTGYIKQFTGGDGARSSLRWHRLILSPQAMTLK